MTRYPIFVDPEVGLPNNAWYWPGWGPFQTPSTASQGSNYYGIALANCAYYCSGIYLSMPTHATYSPAEKMTRDTREQRRSTGSRAVCGQITRQGTVAIRR